MKVTFGRLRSIIVEAVLEDDVFLAKTRLDAAKRDLRLAHERRMAGEISWDEYLTFKRAKEVAGREFLVAKNRQAVQLKIPGTERAEKKVDPYLGYDPNEPDALRARGYRGTGD